VVNSIIQYIFYNSSITADTVRTWFCFYLQLYSEDEVLKNSPTCMFASNVRVKYGGARLFLSKVYRSEYSNWYAHW